MIFVVLPDIIIHFFFSSLLLLFCLQRKGKEREREMGQECCPKTIRFFGLP